MHRPLVDSYRQARVSNTQALTTSFNGWVYLVWNLSVRLQLRITINAGANAVISGLFFYPPPSN